MSTDVIKFWIPLGVILAAFVATFVMAAKLNLGAWSLIPIGIAFLVVLGLVFFDFLPKWGN